MRTQEIDNSQDMIDSRDVIARIEHLEGLDERDESETDELKALLALQEEAEGYAPDWKYGAQLIRESCFTEYAQELAEDCGMIPKDNAWPCTCIDWEKAAGELRMDYTAVEFDGVTYLVR